ncbi:hypothetical protein [Oceanibium sediminis]|uniref:hypothetical protein n=1 Tax=Oceanibium sediminis TaxID=2026339 RepID=UPI0013006E76|nr:hypothetical protein [Oceanibium sediminis]
MQETTRRALIFWAVALAGAIGIVLWTGQHHWLPLAAGLVALISLGVIALNWSAMRKRVAAAEAAADRTARAGDAP